MKPFVAAVILANLADAVTFTLVTSQANLGGELNPAARGLFLAAGILGVWALKAMALPIAGVVCLIGRGRPRYARAMLTVFALISIAAATSNVVYA